MKFEYLRVNQAHYNIKKACKTLNVSRSGFYEYLQRKPSKRMLENEVLSQEIKRIFEEHKSRYGSKRISKVLQQNGINVNHKRVLRLMKRMQLMPAGTRYRYKRYSREGGAVDRPNLLNQSFQTDGKNKIWVGDITYIRTKKGFLYLAVFMDLYSRKVVGWSMSRRIKVDLVINALKQAYDREHPPKGLVVHTDQGSQYTSGSFQAQLRKYGAVSSVSRRGNPYDNALMESFYKTIKRELIKCTKFESPEIAQQEIFKYIEMYYNTKRIHSSLGYLSPTQFEAMASQ